MLYRLIFYLWNCNFVLKGKTYLGRQAKLIFILHLAFIQHSRHNNKIPLINKIYFHIIFWNWSYLLEKNNQFSLLKIYWDFGFFGFNDVVFRFHFGIYVNFWGLVSTMLSFGSTWGFYCAFFKFGFNNVGFRFYTGILCIVFMFVSTMLSFVSILTSRFESLFELWLCTSSL